MTAHVSFLFQTRYISLDLNLYYNYGSFQQDISSVLNMTEKLIIAQLVNQLIAFCGTQKFNTMFKRVQHWLAWWTLS
jgi:hypothetical protein